MNPLFIIPARGGSKGIPHKNIKLLGGIPLIYHTLRVARAIASAADICVSTDDPAIRDLVEAYPQPVPFLRPDALATDTASTYDVLLHALAHYEAQGRQYDTIVLLQPTSPFRTSAQVEEAMRLFTPGLDMVVSVKPSHAPSVLCNETPEGYLEMTLNKQAGRRQEMPPYYEYNGAIYVINVASLQKGPLSGFRRIRKYEMNALTSLDIDTPMDWLVGEALLISGMLG